MRIYDPETRFCIDWFQSFGTADGKAGDAIGMSNAYSLGLADLEFAGVFYAKGGVARLLKRSELSADWHPSMDKRLTHWECAQHRPNQRCFFYYCAPYTACAPSSQYPGLP